MTYSPFALEKQSIFQSLWLKQTKNIINDKGILILISANINRHKIPTFILLIHSVRTLTQQELEDMTTIMRTKSP